MTMNFLHEEAYERPRLGDLARLEQLARLLGEGSNGQSAFQQHRPLGELCSRFVVGDLERLLRCAESD
jgi:hypothetical protein